MASVEDELELDAAEPTKSGVGRFTDLGARIMRLRSEKEWNRTELARRLGVSRDRLSKWERGENAPPLEILVWLGTLLEVTLDELVTGKPWTGDARPAETALPAEMARLAFQVAALRLEQGRDDEAYGLWALGPVEEALSQGRRGDLEDVLAAAVEMLRRFRRNPLLAFDGLPRVSEGLGVDPEG